MVAAEHERDRAGGSDGVHRLLEGAEGALDVARRHLDVARVDDPEVLQRVDPQREVRARAVVREVVGLPDRLRPEAGAGPVRRAAVEGRPDDDHVGVGVRRGVVEVDAGTPRKVMSGPN